MPSEELQHRYPINIGQKVGDFELFQTQLTTLNQFSEHGILPKKDFGKWRTQKCDALIISRVPFLRPIVIGEDKSTGKITKRNWKKLAKDLLESKLNPTETKIGYLTDGASTYWIAGGFEDVKLITRDDNKALPIKIDFNDKAFLSELAYLVNNYDSELGVVKSPVNVNPHALAKSVWQTIWRLKADRPEDCLATFVELFVYKFLNDLNLMKKDLTGTDVSIDHLLSLDKEYCFQYYMKNIRPFIKQLFPEGEDGLSIINGIVFQPTNKDHNYIFHELLKKFIKFGSLKNTDPEFKTKLYESFLQESDTTTTFGQFFTPRKIVGAIYDMAQVGRLSHGREICDPASGVGGFILEQMARDLQGQWALSDDEMKPIHKWKALEIVPKTAILAKANALVHCGDLLADQPSRVPAFAKWLNEVFNCRSNTSLGALDDLSKDKYDLIISNPPYVVSGSADIGKLINNSPKRKEYFARKYSGVEGLFVQFIVQALKPNGDAWVLLPETFFMRSTDKVLRDWVYQNCELDLLALLPERTFFNTPKRVVIAHLKKRTSQLSPIELNKKLAKEKVLLFAVSEIGESRDARRLPIVENDLDDLITAYKLHSVDAPIDLNMRRAVVTESINLFQSKSINIRHYWEKSVAQELGLLTEDEDPITAKKSLDRKMESLESLIEKWQLEQANYPLPKTVKNFKKVKLGEEDIFELRIGQRVLKKDIYQKQTGIPLFSANVRKTFGFVEEANAGNLKYGGALWSIDSDFDSVGVAPGEVYSITDHCGQVEILVEGIEPRYLAQMIKQAGNDMGLNRDFRASLQTMADLEIELPILEDGTYDYDTMSEWSDFQEHLYKTEKELKKLLLG